MGGLFWLVGWLVGWLVEKNFKKQRVDDADDGRCGVDLAAAQAHGGGGGSAVVDDGLAALEEPVMRHLTAQHKHAIARCKNI